MASFKSTGEMIWVCWAVEILGSLLFERALLSVPCEPVLSNELRGFIKVRFRVDEVW